MAYYTTAGKWFDIVNKKTNIKLMGGNGLGSVFSGPLYLVLLVSIVVVSFSLTKLPDYNPVRTSSNVIGVSDVIASDSHQITNVDMGIKNQKIPGCVGGKFELWGEITSNGAGTILYNWEGDRASMSEPLTFEKAETKKVETTWQVYGPGKRQIKLHVFSPNNISSPQILFELQCE